MLYNVQPDRSVTGGAWYSDQDFESEFVEVLNQQCFKFLQSKVSHPQAGQLLNVVKGPACRIECHLVVRWQIVTNRIPPPPFTSPYPLPFLTT